MRIVCLSADASSNSLVRLQPIAKVLARDHEVTVAGFRSGPSVFGPYAHEFDYRTVLLRPLPAMVRDVARLARSVDADLVYAFKPVATALWTGLALRRRLGIPLALDVEDWELGWYLDRRPRDAAIHLAHVERANGFFWTGVNELLARRADQVYVVSRFLQKRFGGTLLPHGPDTSVFDPARWPRTAALDAVGLPDERYVVFTGTLMRNKGVEDVLAALQRLRRPDVRMLIVGSTQHDPAFAEHVENEHGDLVRFVGPQPHDMMPAYLAAASVVVLAQRPERETRAQVPGKVFEAMAMARPIVATAVSDLPEIIQGCGIVIPPSDPAALDEALAQVLDAPEPAEELGRAARETCVDRYGWDAMQRILTASLPAV